MGHPINFKALIGAHNYDEIKVNWDEARKQVDQGKVYEIHIRQPRRTDPQNDMWHAQLRKIADMTGHTLEEVKDAVKSEVLGVEVVTLGPKTYARPPSSSDLPMDVMSMLIERTEAIYHDLCR